MTMKSSFNFHVWLDLQSLFGHSLVSFPIQTLKISYHVNATVFQQQNRVRCDKNQTTKNFYSFRESTISVSVSVLVLFNDGKALILFLQIVDGDQRKITKRLTRNDQLSSESSCHRVIETVAMFLAEFSLSVTGFLFQLTKFFQGTKGHVTGYALSELH